MDDEKDFLASKTTWGVLVPIIFMAAKQAGLDLGDQQGWIDGLSMLAGSVLFMWGQLSRTKRITSIAGVKINANAQP